VLNGILLRVDPISGAQTPVTRFLNPLGIAIAANGDIWVGDVNSGPAHSGEIYRVDSTNGAVTLISSDLNLVNPEGITIDANGDILIAQTFGNFSSGSVVKLDPTTGVQIVVSSGGNLVAPTGIAIVSEPVTLLLLATGLAGLGAAVGRPKSRRPRAPTR
jgi:sugar lactone lactonase YvrE